MSTKTCPKCKQELLIQKFSKDSTTKDGLNVYCRACKASYSRDRMNRNRVATKPQINGKICGKCKNYQPSENFYKCRKNKDGLTWQCKQCVKQRWPIEALRARKRHFERYHSNPTYRLVHNLRARTKYAIKQGVKSAGTLKLLGCTGAECMDYLEKLFWPGMTRQNYGRNGWAVDHIIPVNSFDKTDPNWQFKCFHYTNLQPLWEDDNKSKDDRLDWTPTESKHELPSWYAPTKSIILSPIITILENFVM